MPGVRALSPAEAEQERLQKMLETSPRAYVDKVMVPGDVPAGTDAPEPATGNFRSWFSETRAVTSRTSGDGVALRASRELGQHFGYREETVNYGDYELLADLRTDNGVSAATGPTLFTARRSSSRITLRNFGLPVTTSLFADTTVGDTFSELTEALTRNYRLSLGTRPVRGASARLYSPDYELRAGSGERGNLAGGPFAGFEASGGTMSWVGGTRRTPWGQLGLQFDRASGANDTSTAAPGDETVDSVATAWRWKGEPAPGLGLSTRITAIQSSTATASTGARANGKGWFAEASVLTDSARHEFGLFDADPQLRFGEARIYENRGAYWRMDRQRSNLAWGLGLDVEQQDAVGLSPSARRVGVQANAQLQLDRRHAIGGSLSFDESRLGAEGSDIGASRSHAFYGTAFYQMTVPGVGRTRLLATVRRNQVLVANGSRASGEEVDWEQDWLAGRANPDRPDITTTLGVAHDHTDTQSSFTPTAGLRFTYSPASRWTLDGNLRYTSTRSNLSVTQGLSGFVDSEYELANGWHVGASLNMNQVAVQLADTPLVPTPGTSQLFRTRDTYFAVWARYEGARGLTDRGVGVSESHRVGAGAIAGRVFLDENRDGQEQPQEAGAAGVEVILDGRFRTTTDNAGRFSFPLVTTGVHRINVRPESVPLPWGPADDRGWRAEVPLRGEVRLAIPVVQVGQ